MLGSQIEELLASEMEANGDFAVITYKDIVLCSDYKSNCLGRFWGQFWGTILGIISETHLEIFLGQFRGQFW